MHLRTLSAFSVYKFRAQFLEKIYFTCSSKFGKQDFNIKTHSEPINQIAVLNKKRYTLSTTHEIQWSQNGVKSSSVIDEG